MNEKRAKRSLNENPASSARKHMLAHLQAIHVSHIRRVHAAVAAEPSRAATSTKLACLPIMGGELQQLRSRGLAALRRVGSVTLFRWPADVTAAGYTSTLRPRHFVRIESGDFPKRLERACGRLKDRSGGKASVCLVEIRALHAHLAWARMSRRPAEDVLIPLLPSALQLKPGKQYRRTEVERSIAEA